MKKDGMSALNVGFRWGEGHNAWMIAFGRFDQQTSTLRACVSSRGLLGDGELRDLLVRESDLLQETPLQFFGLLVEVCGRFLDHKTQQYNRRMLEIAGSLEVADRNWVEGWDIKTGDLGNKAPLSIKSSTTLAGYRRTTSS